MRSLKYMVDFILLSCFVFALAGESAHAQTDDKSNVPPKITLEDIWASPKFSSKYIAGFNFAGDEKSYLRLSGNDILRYDITSGRLVDTILVGSALKKPNGEALLFNNYQMSSDGEKFLLATEQERVYRYSSKAHYYVYDKAAGELQVLHDGDKQMYPTFSPLGDKVAFVSDNDLYIKDLFTGAVQQITEDGKSNHIINGASDWVYEEEFSLTRAYEWSPEGNFIAYIKFDETEVPEFTMEMYNDDLYPERITFKYPKVGEKNANVTLHVYNLDQDTTILADLGDLEYIPRLTWTNAPERIIAFTMNRHQNELQLKLTHPVNGRHTVLLEEKNPYYIDINDDLYFFSSRKWFVWSSERSGFNHLYLYDMNGRLLNAITSGDFDVTSFYGVDEERERIYFQAADDSPMTRNIYYTDFSGDKMVKINPNEGYNSGQFSSTFDYWVNTFSTINTPPEYSVLDNEGNTVRVIEDNADLRSLHESYELKRPEFFNFMTGEGVSLNGYLIKPRDFDPDLSYPVFMFLYGGPNSQQVTDSWKGANYWWLQMIAQEGYIVACVDNRGTGARGQTFRKMTYLQLGHYETIDQIEAAKYLGNLPYTDSNRIGIYGWSYGGYMSSLCLLKGNDVFKAAIAVAPVTNWKWYDTIYTERYMRTEEENPDGYKNNSPVYFADRLKGSYLLIHGMADDNVHFQHAVEMARALIAANKQFDTYYYPNKNHGIYGGYTRLHLFTKMTNFIKEKI